jgi:hypothetical protein
LYLLYFSQPAADRALYKAVRSRRVRSIVEIGIGRADRTERLLEAATWRRDLVPVRYTGIDLFEARPQGQHGLTLKHAFARFQRPDVRVQLVPGDPHSALVRVANSLAATDLLLIAADVDGDSLARAWSWIPRMLTASSAVFLEQADGDSPPRWRQIPLDEVHQRAAQIAQSMRRAA